MDDIGQGGPWAGIAGRRWVDSVVLEALSRFVEPALIRQVLTQTGKDSRRIRRLPAAAMVWLVIAPAMDRRGDIASAWRQVVGTVQALWFAAALRRPPCSSAFSAPGARRRLAGGSRLGDR